MKKIKVLMVAVLACCAVSVSAQSDYDKTVMEYMSAAGGESSIATITEGISKAMASTGKSDDESAKAMEELLPRIMTSMTDAFKNAGCTEADMQTVTAALQTPEGQEAAANLQKAMSEKNLETAMSTCQNSIMALMQGQPADPIPAPEVSASYKSKFHTCFNTCNIGSTLTQAIDAMKSMLGDQPEAQQMIQSLGMFFTFNAENIMLTSSKDILTEANLDTLNSIYSTPAGKKVMAAQQEATKAVLAIAMGEVQKTMK